MNLASCVVTTVKRMHVTGQRMTTQDAKTIEDGPVDIDSRS